MNGQKSDVTEQNLDDDDDHGEDNVVDDNGAKLFRR